MMQYENQQARGFSAAEASVDDRAGFIVRTYLHLVGAIFAFVAIETALFASGLAFPLLELMFGNPIMLVGTLIAFVVGGMMARSFARSTSSPLTAYLALGVYVLLECIIFLPMLAFAAAYDPSAVPTAGLVTLTLFGGLTGVVFLTRRDFSFLRGILAVATLGAFATAIAAMIFGFSLGVVFSGAMVVLAGGWILYDTSKVLHHYRTDQHVSASLELFASLALLFYYVLRIFLSARR